MSPNFKELIHTSDFKDGVGEMNEAAARMRWTRFQKKIEGGKDGNTEVTMKPEDSAMLVCIMKQSSVTQPNFKLLAKEVEGSLGEMKDSALRMRWNRLSKKLGIKGEGKARAPKTSGDKAVGKGAGKAAGKAGSKGRKKAKAEVEDDESEVKAEGDDDNDGVKGDVEMEDAVDNIKAEAGMKAESADE